MLRVPIRQFADVWIVAAKRTPIGSFMGGLSKEHASKLASTTISAWLEQAGLEAKHVDEVYLGNALQAAGKQNPARQASMDAGIPETTPATTVNKSWSSGLKSAIIGAQTIRLDDNATVIAGGFESMSQAPFYMLNHRQGHLLGDTPTVDAIMYDGLTWYFNNMTMGLCAEQANRKHGLSKSAQDEWARMAYRRAIAAWDKKFFAKEVCSVNTATSKGTKAVDKDEEYTKINFDLMDNLLPVFDPEGTITVANSSMINDGAATVVLMSEHRCEELGVKPLARIVSYGDAATAPEYFAEAPAMAATQWLTRASLPISQVDLHEVNDSFSTIPLIYMKKFGLEHKFVNINGGAVSLGHPIAASSARILVTMIYTLKEQKKRLGMVSVGNGGGGGCAMLIENIE